MSGMKMMCPLPSLRVSFVAVGLTALAMTGVVSTKAMADSLNEALIEAYTTNPTLEAARANLRATNESVPQAKAGFRPTVSATGTTGRSRTESNSTTKRTYRTPSSATVTLSQPLFNGGATMYGVSAAENTVYAARWRLLATEQQILQSAATSYMNVLRDQAVLDLNVNSEQVLMRQLEATQDRFRVGEITRTDVNLAQARLAGATADRIQAEGAYESSLANFVNVVGRMPTEMQAPTMTFVLPKSYDETLKEALDANPTIMAAQFDEIAAEDAIVVARSSLLPSVSLSGSAGRALNASSPNTWSNTGSAAVSVTVPLYQGGAEYSKLRAAKQSAAAARLTADQAKRTVTEQSRQAWQSLKTARARSESIQTQVNAAQVALEGVEREAGVGSRTLLDVLDSEQELLDARVNLVSSQTQEIIASVQLLSAVGRLTAQDLNLPVDFYDVSAHYGEVRGKWFGGRSSGQDVGQD